MKRLLIIALLAGLISASGHARGSQPGQSPAAPVSVENARQDTFSSTLWVSGTVISRHDAQIAAETDGRITWVAEVGSRIEQGSALAKIDTGDLELELRDSEARLESLRAQLRYQENNARRLRQLAASNNAAANQADQAQAELDMNRQEIKRAVVAVAQFSGRLRQAHVFAPL
jgi:multidrug efflux pump subunit AcrA (membrane-fusion protein)